MPSMTIAEFDAFIGNDQVGSAELKKRLTRQQRAGTPVANLTPRYVGDWAEDTAAGDLYWAPTLLAAGWKKLTP